MQNTVSNPGNLGLREWESGNGKEGIGMGMEALDVNEMRFVGCGWLEACGNPHTFALDWLCTNRLFFETYIQIHHTNMYILIYIMYDLHHTCTSSYLSYRFPSACRIQSLFT